MLRSLRHSERQDGARILRTETGQPYFRQHITDQVFKHKFSSLPSLFPTSVIYPVQLSFSSTSCVKTPGRNPASGHVKSSPHRTDSVLQQQRHYTNTDPYHLL